MLSIHLAWNTFPQESWALIFWKNVKLKGENQAPSFAMFSWYSVCAWHWALVEGTKKYPTSPFISQFPVWETHKVQCLCSNINTQSRVWSDNGKEEFDFDQEIQEGFPEEAAGSWRMSMSVSSLYGK